MIAIRTHAVLGLLLAASLLWPLAGQGAVPSHAVVFIYHRFGDNRYPSTNIALPQFEAQLTWLAENHYQVWPLPRIVEYLETNRPIPDHVVAITIDDAFQSAYVHAYPLLKARGWPFTVFVSTGAEDAHLPDYMTWDELRDMGNHGANFGNHTVNHAHLTFRQKGESDEAWADRVRRDILGAQARLHAELGPHTNTSPKLFAYPYGEFDKDLAELVNGLGYVAFGQQAGALSEPLDPRALPRFPIEEHFGDMPSFIIDAQSLPMPLESVQPWNPAVGGDNPPRMVVSLTPGVIPPDALHCYLNGPPMTITWLNAAKTQFSLQADHALGVGRSRYNCTAMVYGRYYWYSHMWLRAPNP
ncbi:MAG: polysaccharide deacetylase family protein [Gammaproteobacteria bacterium]